MAGVGPARQHQIIKEDIMTRKELNNILNSVRTPDNYKVVIRDETGETREVNSVAFNTKNKVVIFELEKETNDELPWEATDDVYHNQSGPAPV
jgi:hypothetical protein